MEPVMPGANDNRVALERMRRDTLLAAQVYVARRNIVLEKPGDESALADLTEAEIQLQVNALAWALAGQAWVDANHGASNRPNVIICRPKEIE